jgi:hypothetical protein
MIRRSSLQWPGTAGPSLVSALALAALLAGLGAGCSEEERAASHSGGNAGAAAGGAGGGGGSGGIPSGICAPGGGPYWLEELEQASFPIACATGFSLPGSAFSFESLPAGASYDAATASITWRPELNQAGVVLIGVTVAELAESGVVKIGVADRFDHPDNVPVIDKLGYSEEFGLPVLQLELPAEIDDLPDSASGDDLPYWPATIVHRGHTYLAEAKYRGHSSLAYPKKNYTLRFAMSDRFNEPEHAGGFLGKRNAALITTFDDASHVRARLAFELWNRMDPSNIQVQHLSVVVYVNGEYRGVYALTDKIEENLFGAHGYSEAGNLYMGIDHRANFAAFRYDEEEPQNEGDLKQSFDEGWEKKEGTPPQGMAGAFDDIAALVELVATADDATFSAQIATRLDLQNYYNWIIHSTAIQAFDTLGKNTLHYHDPLLDTPWRVVLWDFNESFAQTWQTTRFEQSIDPAEIVYSTEGGVGYTNRNWLWRRLWNDPTFGARLRERYGSLLRGDLAIERVLEAFDAMVIQVAKGAARDARRWQASHEEFFEEYRSDDFNDPAAEAALIRRWLIRRWTDLRSWY